MAENGEYTSLSELENDKSKWNLASDLKLLNTFKFTTEEILKKIQNNFSVFDDLSYKTNVCTDKINNLITDVLILTNSKFIENRVYEEDIKEIAPSNKPSPFKKDDQSNSEQVVVEKLKNSIICGINCLFQRYDISPGDMESLFERNNLMSTLYVHNNRFASKPLPYLIGSDDFTKDTFVGLNKVDSDGPVIVLNHSNDYESQHVDDADSMASKASSGSFDFGVNQANNQTGKSNGVVPSTEEQPKEPLFLNPTRNIFGSDFYDDDIFTEKVVPICSTNANHRVDNETKDILNQDATSNNSNASIVKEIKNTNHSFPKPNNDFFDSISNGDSDDDLFEKRPTVAPIKSVDFDVKSDVSSSNNDTSSSTTINEVEKRWNEHSLTSTTKTTVKSRLDSIFSSDEDEDVDIFNVSISTKTGNSTKPAAKVNAFSSDDDDDDLFSQLKKNDSKPTLISPGTSKAAKLSTEATKVPVEPRKFTSSKVPFMPNVISELSAALKDKKVACIDYDNNSEGEFKTPIEKLVSNVTSSGTSPKSKVVQSSNLFNVGEKLKDSSPKQKPKFIAFSSDEDDDNNLFSQVKKTVSNPVASSLFTSKTGTVSDEPQKVQFQVPILADSTEPPKESETFVEQKDKLLSPNASLMPNLISELGVTLTSKKIERCDLGNQDEVDNLPVVENSSKPTPTLEYTVLPTPLGAADPNDSFNDMLKHKAKLNAKRNRKRPSLMASSRQMTLNTADAVIVDEKVEPTSTNNDPVSESQEKPMVNKLPSSLPSIDSPRFNNSTLNSILSSSDESDSDLFSAKSSSKTIGASVIVPATPTKSSVSLKASKPTFLDTSDDSDGDLFSKPAAPISIATIRPAVVVSEEAKRAPIPLFNDSDDGDDDFLSASLATISADTQTNRSAAKKPEDTKKSIFDHDSDSDDLFK